MRSHQTIHDFGFGWPALGVAILVPHGIGQPIVHFAAKAGIEDLEGALNELSEGFTRVKNQLEQAVQAMR